MPLSRIERWEPAMRKLALICTFLCLPFSANAASGGGPNPYSDCGIGAAIFGDTAWAAATSNVIWDLGITAIVSAVSSPETCNAQQAATARLILETLPSLEQDLAAGTGAHLVALNQTMGCDAASVDALNAGIRSAYADVVSAPEYGTNDRVQRASDLYETVRGVAAETEGACQVVL